MKDLIIKKWRQAVLTVSCVVLWWQCADIIATAQTNTDVNQRASYAASSSVSLLFELRPAVTLYLDQARGMTADDAVAYALAHNGELRAARQEIAAAQALVRQARQRANPMLDVGGTRQINGSDNSVMISGSLPLELGRRREARVSVAERELTIRELMIAERERTLAAEVRAKFGEALAQNYKFGFTEDLLATSQRGYQLVSARVTEGRSAPLEQNMTLVELNRLRSLRETSEGKVQVALLELRNLLGMNPEESLRLRGDFKNLIAPLQPMEEATTIALNSRPDLRMARAKESLAAAQIEQARAEGRPDASANVGYQRMSSGFPVNGINDAGQLRPVMDTFHFLTFGVSINVPVRNKNLGAIEAAAAGAQAAKSRREFAELSVRREVAVAYARYERAARAMEIFRGGVLGQASENLDVVRQTYELGAKTLLDYISEQRRYIEVENEYIDAMLDAYQARVTVDSASAAPELIKK